jgi:putative membrane protein
VLRITLASLHLLALSLGLMATVLRGSALREPLTPSSLKRALRLDNIWGLAAALWIVTGLWRLLGGIEKPLTYYLSNHWFMAKMGGFALIVVLEIWPMLTMFRARLALRRGGDVAAIVTPAAKRIAIIGHVQATIALVMIFMAVAMARGYGLMATR